MIKVNNLEIKNIEKEKDNYNFYVKIKPNEYEKIELNYTTENDLKNAKVLKYNLDNFKGKKVNKFNIDVKIPEEDVPLVKKIYPECFEYADNDINVKYYDFTVNNLTKDFIIEKETYKNLNYGEELKKTEVEEEIVKRAKDLILKGTKIEYSKYINENDNEFMHLKYESDQFIKDLLGVKIDSKYEGYYKYTDGVFESIIEYIIYKQAQRDNIVTVKNKEVALYTGDFALTKYLVNEYSYSNIKENLVGKRVCVDYVESEGDKELYIAARVGDTSQTRYVKKDELSILKMKEVCGESTYYNNYLYSYKRINIGININGDKIDVTEKEKIEYVNMLNADLYIRLVIYDGNVTEKYTYNDSHSGKAVENERRLSSIIAYYENDKIDIAKNYNYNNNEKTLKKFDNEDVVNYCKVPVVVQAVANRETENGKYIIKTFKYNEDGLLHIYSAINTQKAKTLIQANNEENETTKQKVEDEIVNVKIADDTEEFNINKKEEIKENPIQEITQETGFKLNLNNTEIIIICILSGAILLNIIIIVVNKKRNKK